MALIPTDDQVKALRLVEQSSTGIGALVNKDDGLDCVKQGWLLLREHRQEEGGVIDVWELTGQGRQILIDHVGELGREIAA